MNPDEAYRLQTDWARAIKRPGSPSADWFEARMNAFLQQETSDRVGGEPFRRLGEPQTIESLRRGGPFRVAQVVLGYEPAPPRPSDELPGDVFEPYAEPAPMTAEVSDVVIPRSVYTQVTTDALAAAPTYYVSRDMCTVIEAAAAAFDHLDLMPRMPSWSGFVVLAKPIELPMADGVPQQVRAFAWNQWGSVGTSLNTAGSAGEVWTFASRKQDADMEAVADAAAVWPSKKAWQNDPDLLPVFVDNFVTGSQLPPVAEPAAVSNARSLAHSWFTRTQEPKLDADGEPIRPSVEEWEAQLTAMQARYDRYLAAERHELGDVEYGFFQPYLAAFVLLLTQQITVAEKQPASPSAARLAGDVARNRPGSVTVVDVRHARRTGDPEPTGQKRGALTERHLVGGHWKWQPYGEGRALRRRIYVGMYERGPEDAPLVVKPRVTRLS